MDFLTRRNECRCAVQQPRHLSLIVSVLVAIATSAESVPGQELTTLSGHVGGVVQSQLTSGGKILVSGGHDATIRIWNAADATLLRTLEGHEDQVLSLALTNDGRYLLSGARDNSIRLWDVFVPDPVARWEEHRMKVTAVLLGPEGKWVATGSADKSIKIRAAGEEDARRLGRSPEAIAILATNATGTLLASGDIAGNVQLWNPETGLLLGKINAHAGELRGLAFHPTEARLISAGSNGTVKHWALPLVNSRVVPASESEIPAVVFSPDGKLAFAADAKELRSINPVDGKVVQLFEGQQAPLSAVAINKEGTLLAGGSDAGVVRFWNAADATAGGTILGHAGKIHAVVFHPSEPRGMSAGADGTIRLWNLPIAPRMLAGHTATVQTLSASADGKWIATGSDDKSVRIWNAADGTLAQTFAPDGGAEVVAIAFQPDAAQLATGDKAGMLRTVSVADGAESGQLKAHAGAVVALAYRPDAAQLVTSGADGLVKWWNLPFTPDRVIAELPAELGAAVSDGKTIVAGAADGAIRQVDVASGNQLRAFPGHIGPVASLALHPQGTHLASGQDDGGIRVFKASDGVILATLNGHTGTVNSLAFHPTQPHLVSGGKDGTVRYWSIPDPATIVAGSEMTVQAAAVSADKTLVAVAGMVADKAMIQVRNAANGQVMASLVGHAAAVTSLAFSPDKARLVSGSADKTARIWTTADAAAEPVVLEGHTAAVMAVAFSSDGAQVFSGGADNAIRQWNVADGAEVRTLAGHTQSVNSLSVAGTVLASGSGDAGIRLWNTADGAAIRTLAHGGPVSLVRLSPDGKLLASVGADKIIKLSNTADGAAVASLQGHADAVSSLAFSSDSQRMMSSGGTELRTWSAAGELLEGIPVTSATSFLAEFAPMDVGYLGVDTNNGVRKGVFALQRVIRDHEGVVDTVVMALDGASVFSGGADKVIRRTMLADGMALATLTGAEGPISDMALSGDGKQLVAGSANSVHRWDVATAVGGAAVEPAAGFDHPQPVVQVGVNLDASRITTAESTGTIRLWDTTSGLQLQQLDGHAGQVQGVYLSDDGTFVLSAGQDKSLRQWTPAIANALQLGEKPPTDLAWTSDSKIMAMAGPDSTIRLWDQATTTVKSELVAGEMPLSSVAIQKGDTRLVAGGADGNLYHWPLAAGVPGELAMHATPGPISRVDFDAEGTRLMAASADGHVRVFDGELARVVERVPVAEAALAVGIASDGKSILSSDGNNTVVQGLAVQSVITGHDGAVTDLLIKPDGSQLVSGGADMTVRLWNVADGTSAGTLAGPTAAVTGLSLSQDATRLVASCADKNLYSWTLAANPNNLAADLTIPHPESVLGATISPDKARIVTSSVDGVVRAWDVASGLLLESFIGHEGAVTSLGLAVDGKTVVSGGFDKTVRFWNVAAEIVFAADAEKIAGFVMLPDASQVGVVGTEPQVKWFGADGAAVRQFAGAATALGQLEMNSDSTQVASADANGVVTVWNVADGAVVTTIETGAAAIGLGFVDDKKSILVAGADSHLRAYDIAEGTLIQDHVATEPQSNVVSLLGGREYLSADDSGNVLKWTIASPTARVTMNGHNVVYGLDVNSNGTIAASCGADNTVRLWNLASGEAVRELAGHEGPVYSVQFSSDDKLLVSSSADGTVRVWNVEDGAQLKSLAPQVADGETVVPIYDASFDPKAEVILSANSLGVLQVWNVVSGEPIRSIGEPGEAIYQVAFSSTGERFLACGHAGTLTVRNLADGAAAFTVKLPSVAYSAQYAPNGDSISAACANGNSYLVPIPEEAR